MAYRNKLNENGIILRKKGLVVQGYQEEMVDFEEATRMLLAGDMDFKLFK